MAATGGVVVYEAFLSSPRAALHFCAAMTILGWAKLRSFLAGELLSCMPRRPYLARGIRLWSERIRSAHWMLELCFHGFTNVEDAYVSAEYVAKHAGLFSSLENHTPWWATFQLIFAPQGGGQDHRRYRSPRQSFFLTAVAGAKRNSEQRP
jgi:hypothetical protein